MDLNGARIGASSAVTPRTHPIRLARKLERGRSAQRFFAARSQGGWLIASLTVLASIVALVAWQRLQADGAMLIAPLHAHLVRVAVVAVLTVAGGGGGRAKPPHRRTALCGVLACDRVDRPVLAARRWRATP